MGILSNLTAAANVGSAETDFKEWIADIVADFDALRTKIEQISQQPSRELAVVKTKLDEAELWLHAHLFK